MTCSGPPGRQEQWYPWPKEPTSKHPLKGARATHKPLRRDHVRRGAFARVSLDRLVVALAGVREIGIVCHGGDVYPLLQVPHLHHRVYALLKRRRAGAPM